MGTTLSLPEADRRDETRLTQWIGSRLADYLVSALVVLVIAAPLIFTTSGFAADFTNHLWLIWAAGHALAQAGHPSYFLNTSDAGVFYPWYAFYGGTLYMLTGGLGELLGGNAVLAYIAAIMLAITATYGGMLWLGRQLGLSKWLSHAPALTVVTSAYYVTNLYGRGAWTEVMATSAIAPLLASALYLTRAPSWRPWPVFVFVSSTIVFTGSHNITLLWGAMIGALGLIVLWLAVGTPRRLPVRRLTMVAGLGLASLLVSAWYLLPDISYAQDVRGHLETGLGPGNSVWHQALKAIFAYDTPGMLLDPLRSVPTGAPPIYVQIPDWFVIWGLASGLALLWRRGRRPALRRAWIGAIAFIAILLTMVMLDPLWRIIPFPFDALQFPFRLGSYLAYGAGALVLVGALALQRHSSDAEMRRKVKWLRATLVGVCAISAGLCAWQLWTPSALAEERPYQNREEALASVYVLPHSWYDPGSYRDEQAPVVAVPAGRVLLFSPASIHGDRFAGSVEAPAGTEPIQTNIAGGSYLVHISGLTAVGRSESGYTVVKRTKQGSGPVYVVVETTHSATILLGRVLSILAIGAILAILAWTSVLTRRRDRRTRSSLP